MTLIRTPRLWLRDIGPDDVDDIDALNRAPGVMRYLGTEPPSRGSTVRRIDELVAQAAPGLRRFAVLSADGCFVGWCGVGPSAYAHAHGPHAGCTDLAIGELGYRLRPEFWRQGIATEAARACVQHAFQVGDADVVFARTMAVNEASRGVMRHIGMRHVASYHEHHDDPVEGTDQGEVRYEVTRGEFEAARVDPRAVLRGALTRAMKARDRDAVGALRVASAAIANAEAVPASGPHTGDVVISSHVAGAVLGVGAADVERVWLDDAAVTALIAGERDDARPAGRRALDAVLAALR